MHIKTFGLVDQRSLEQLKRCMEAGDAEFGVLCADHHPGYAQPIRGAIAYEGYVSPSGVGFDVACGNKAAQTDMTVADLGERGGVETIMREITSRISFGMGVPARERLDHPVLDRIRSAAFARQRKLHQIAESQLGTIGSGNHFVNLFEDEEGKVWIGVHFGSRGFGHKTASGFLALAQGLAFDTRAHEGEMDSPPVLFEIDSELGQSYIAAMDVAGDYPMRAATSSSTRCSTSSVPKRPTRSTTTTTSPGARRTSAATTGSSARAARRRDRVRRGSWVGRWATSR